MKYKKDKDYKIRFTTFSDYIIKNYSEIKLKNSVVVIDSNNKFFRKSGAVILCLKTIDYNKSLMSIFEIIPRPILDILYSLVAVSRYKIFGKRKILLYQSILSQNIEIILLFVKILF